MGFGKDGKGVIIRESRSQAIGTLASQTALLIGTKLVTLERFRMLKVEMLASIIGATASELRGMWLGIADGDLSVTEIEEAIEANGPLGPNDTVIAATAERWVMMLGMVEETGATVRAFDKADSGGHLLTLNPRWTFSRTKSWNYFLYNMGEAPTTGSSVLIRAKSFGVWVT